MFPAMPACVWTTQFWSPEDYCGSNYVHKLFSVSGRINLVELVKLLSVDLNQIAARAAEIERTDQNCSLVLGQLIDKTYVNRIAEEINERLLQQGQVTIGDLTRHYDLPSDFLQMVNIICIAKNFIFISSFFEVHKIN